MLKGRHHGLPPRARSGAGIAPTSINVGLKLKKRTPLQRSANDTIRPCTDKTLVGSAAGRHIFGMNSSGQKSFSTTQWLVVVVAAIGFLFDTYELLMTPLVGVPAIAELLKQIGRASCRERV